MSRTPSGILLVGLRETLSNREIKPADFARMSGLDPGHLHRLLTGERRAGYGTVNRIAEALGIPPEKLLENNCQLA
jgi:transcriptional regulator with XRE-family HTH domain